MTTHSHRERLAWSTLLLSFLACLALTAGVPLGLQWYVTTADLEQVAWLDVSTGTLIKVEGGQASPVGVPDQLVRVGEGARLETGDESQASLTIAEPKDQITLAALQLYGNTHLEVISIRSPRYAWSSDPHRLTLNLSSGRLRLVTLAATPRVVLTIHTPQGQVTVDTPGKASIEVSSADTTVVVREGAGEVTSAEGVNVVLQKDQRAVVTPGELPRVSAAARNIIVNGDFLQPNVSGWEPFSERARADEPEGTVSVARLDGRQAAHFSRLDTGLDSAQLGLRQVMLQDVRNLRSLRLHVLLQAANQDLFNCGVVGSECPVMIKLRYVDENGRELEWLQGFYSNERHSNQVPTACTTCYAPAAESHRAVPSGSWYAYDSPNLIDLFKQAGVQPVTLTAVEIYASGHAFESYVTEVELLAQD